MTLNQNDYAFAYPSDRTKEAKSRRIKAAEVAASRPQARHKNNQEEALEGKPANFRKGLKHNSDGFLADERDYQAFRLAILSGDPNALDAVMVDNSLDDAKDERRKWESPSTGFVFDLEGADAQSITIPPAPTLDSDELVAEMAEVYAMAALRDTYFAEFEPATKQWIDRLNSLNWFKEPFAKRCPREYEVNEIFHGATAGRYLGRQRGEVTLENIFRGVTKGDNVGPYISQFLLIGNESRGADSVEFEENNLRGNEWDESAGKIRYGAQAIDQRVRIATCDVDFMENNPDWLDVQNGKKVNRCYRFDQNPDDYCPFQGTGDPNMPNGPAYRFISTPRDLATYVHFDQLYQAYLNACIIMLERGVKTDPGFSRFSNGINQEGFAQFGGPHILSLVTEVATRALKAVRFQKFNIHNRARPEFLGGLMAQLQSGNTDCRLDPLRPMWKELKKNNIFENNDAHFLSMAFPEGSPMHPSYGAGHATVAGACVTILKAFFDHTQCLTEKDSAYQADPLTGGRTIKQVESPALTVEGELNKLASNISIGRDWAGVHYFSDYLESLRLGELIALSILEEQALMYNRLQFPFFMTVPLYDGGTVVIGS